MVAASDVAAASEPVAAESALISVPPSMAIPPPAGPQAAIEAYVASGEPFGKAGAYAIQSMVAAWVERIDGSQAPEK